MVFFPSILNHFFFLLVFLHRKLLPSFHHWQVGPGPSGRERHAASHRDDAAGGRGDLSASRFSSFYSFFWFVSEWFWENFWRKEWFVWKCANMVVESLNYIRSISFGFWGLCQKCFSICARSFFFCLVTEPIQEVGRLNG